MHGARLIDRLATEAVRAWYGRLLEREGWARCRLAPHAGKSVLIDLDLVRVHLGVSPRGGLVAAAGEPVVTLAIAAPALAGAAFERMAAAAPAAPHVRIEGDAGFAQDVVEILQRLRPDPAEELAPLVGDAAAERLVALVRAALDRARDTGVRLARQAADHLALESAVVVGAAEWSRFRAEVDGLQARLERLERLERGRAAPG